MNLQSAIGREQCWQFSPAIDLQDPLALRPHTNADDVILGRDDDAEIHDGDIEKFSIEDNSGLWPDQEVVHLLMSGAGDACTVLKTLANARRWRRKKVNIYMVEESAERLARSVLLVKLALDTTIASDERVHLWLEVFGNIFLREKAHGFLTDNARALSSEIASSSYTGAFDFSHLRYKNRDLMDDAIRFWTNEKPFDIEKLRDQRLRHYFADRFDHRSNVLNWDYTMNLKPEASIIHTVHYTRWRLSGQAFEIREASYTKPNRTLMGYASGKDKRKGTSVAVCGYWSDTAVSPYVSLGVESQKKSLFEVRSHQHFKTAVDVCQFNLKCLFFLLETGKQWIDEDRSAVEDVTDISNEGMSEVNSGPQISIIPVIGMQSTIFKKDRYKNLFHRIFLSSGAGAAISNDLNQVCRCDCILSVETARFIPVLRKEERQRYSKAIRRQASNTGWQFFDGRSIDLEIDDLEIPLASLETFVRSSSSEGCSN